MKLILVAIAICIISEVSATLNLCSHNQEIDVCNTCQRNRGITAPRPHPISPPRLPSIPLIKTICRQETVEGPKPFNPIGDVCNCGQQIIKPAPLPNIPRPSCLPSLPQLNFHKPCSCSACNSPSDSPATPECGHPVRAPEHYQIYNDKGATIYLDAPKKKHEPVKHYPKADAVSVAIASELAKKAQNSISEKQLQYGSLKEPIVPERTENKPKNNIREESFYETKGEVLEINSNLFNYKQVSSESESSEEQVKPKKVEPFRPPHLKYHEIGYTARKPSNAPRYVVVKNKKPANHDCPHTTRRPHHHHIRNHFRRPAEDCGCNKDLVVDQSEISEHSVSYENNSDQYLLPRGPLST